ncbi:hypothetical protein ACTQ54_01110 [Fundicoccus sp. Sow4_H7]|uniref:hypothetical protein n=1 Tax=Fundicoccus sp. Sow4_H7 TaxID=3438784 RepID=UPI003F8FD088
MFKRIISFWQNLPIYFHSLLIIGMLLNLSIIHGIHQFNLVITSFQDINNEEVVAVLSDVYIENGYLQSDNVEVNVADWIISTFDNETSSEKKIIFYQDYLVVQNQDLTQRIEYPDNGNFSAFDLIVFTFNGLADSTLLVSSVTRLLMWIFILLVLVLGTYFVFKTRMKFKPIIPVISLSLLSGLIVNFCLWAFWKNDVIVSLVTAFVIGIIFVKLQRETFEQKNTQMLMGEET